MQQRERMQALAVPSESDDATPYKKLHVNWTSAHSSQAQGSQGSPMKQGAMCSREVGRGSQRCPAVGAVPACLLTPHSLGKSPESPPRNHSTGGIPLIGISACRSTLKPWGFGFTGQCRLDRLQPDPRLLDRTRAGNVNNSFDCRNNATMRLWQAAQEIHPQV